MDLMRVDMVDLRTMPVQVMTALQDLFPFYETLRWSLTHSQLINILKRDIYLENKFVGNREIVKWILPLPTIWHREKLLIVGVADNNPPTALSLMTPSVFSQAGCIKYCEFPRTHGHRGESEGGPCGGPRACRQGVRCACRLDCASIIISE